MGINLNEVSGLAGGASQGYQQGVDTRISRNQENRAQTQENERRQKYERNEELNAILGELPGMLKPGQQQLPAATPGPAAQPQAIPAPAAGGAPAPGGAPPAAGAPPGAEALSTMDVAGEADPTGPRDRIAELRARASKAAAGSGGMQAMDAVDKYFDMQVQGQMYDYATEGIRAVSGGNAAEAVRYLNTAMEIATVDPGIEFFAMNGEVYGQRGDGEPQKYKQEDLVGLTESYLMNPENYMAWQKQILEETKADTDKAYKEGVVDVAKRGVAVEEGALPSQNAARSAGAISDLMVATAAQDRAALAAQGKELGWDANNYLKINDVAKDLLNKGELGTGGMWGGKMIENPQLEQQLLGGVTEIIKSNSPEKANYQYAAMLSQMAMADSAGVPLEAGTTLPPLREAGGQFFAQLEGIEYQVPASIYLGIQQAKRTRREQ